MRAEPLRLRLSFDGSFGLEDALRASGQVAGAIRGALVSLDFVRCREVDPTGLARLTKTIVDQGGRVELIGLTRHDLRILAYLGGPLGTTQAEHEASD